MPNNRGNRWHTYLSLPKKPRLQTHLFMTTDNTDITPDTAQNDEVNHGHGHDDQEGELEVIRVNQSPLAFDDGTTPSDRPLTSELFERYKQKVYGVRPNFKDINDTSGNLFLYDYLRRHIRENRESTIKKRKPEFINVVGEETRRLLGSEIAESVMRQLKGNNVVSTIQHSAPLSHPYVLSSTLQNALPSFGQTHPNLHNTIVLSCANVSFNNYKFPRGHIFHSFSGSEVKSHLLTLFGHTADARPVIHHPPYDHNAVTEIKNRILAIQREGDLTKEEADKLISFFEEVHEAPHPLSADNYHDQLTIVNYWIFKKMFSEYRKPVPNLVFLSQEKITLELIKAIHLNGDTLLHKLLFDESMRQLVVKHFNGLNGAFSLEQKYGTFFFWALPKDSKYRMQLWPRDGRLVSNDGSYSLELQPEKVREAIIANELIPNTLLTFITLSFYYGQYLGGGPAQTLNLTRMKEAFMNLLSEIQDTESSEAVKDVITTNLIISRPTLAFIDIPGQDRRIPATGLDMLLYGDNGKSWDRILEATKKTTLSEFFYRALESFYAEYVPPQEKEPELTSITERDIEKFVGLDQKVPALITLPKE